MNTKINENFAKHFLGYGLVWSGLIFYGQTANVFACNFDHFMQPI